MVKAYAVVYLNERTWKTGMDVFSGCNPAEAKQSFRECYRHSKYRILSIVEIPRKEIKAGSDNITIDGHCGTWYVIDDSFFKGEKVFLLEHEELGDEAAGLIVDSKGNVLLDDVHNGFYDLHEREGMC